MNWGVLGPALGTLAGIGGAAALGPAAAAGAPALLGTTPAAIGLGGALGGAAGTIGGQFAPKDMPSPMANPAPPKPAFMPQTAPKADDLMKMLQPGQKGMLQHPFAGR